MAIRRKQGETRTTTLRRAIRNATTRTVVAGASDAITVINNDITAELVTDIFKPPLFQFDHIGNLFEKNRPGNAVVRSDDLLALRVEARNLDIVSGDPPRLVKTSNRTSYLILHFPPQAIIEQTFYEAEPPGTDLPPDDPDAGGSGETPPDPPVRARIADESRIVFRVPNDFDIPYTLEGVLEACESLALSVTNNSRPPPSTGPTIEFGSLFDKAAIQKLSPAQRGALAGFAVRSLRLAAVQRDDATLRLRQFGAAEALKPVPADKAIRIPDLSVRPNPPKPALPSATRTAIELPWRLVISPHANERWRHAAAPVTSEATGHTELWHTRLVAPGTNGSFIEPPYADPQRTIRAVWAKTGESSTVTMNGDFPSTSNPLPAPHNAPFRMPMNDFDRFQIAHLSSNFSRRGFTPQPVDTHLLMLSALGGWLDSRGAWEPPTGMSVEEWVHRASMARDHYVRIVYKGFLLPFGHRVSLVKVSERKFHNGALIPDDDNPGQFKPGIEYRADNAAFLRQRLFIVVRERERTYGGSLHESLRDIADTKRYLYQLPFSKVRILTQVTPNLDDPTTNPSDINGQGQLLFWPHVADQAFRFQCTATDLDGRTVAFDMPMIFIENTLAAPGDFPSADFNMSQAQAEYRNKTSFNTVPFKGQRVALAASNKAGDTTVETEEVQFDIEAEVGNATLHNASEGFTRPVCFPGVKLVTARVGALAHLGGTDANNELTWNAHYVRHGFGANAGQIFADVANKPGMALLDFSSQGDRSGGYVQPNLKPKALSRLTGPMMGDVGSFISGSVPDGAGFPTSPDDLPLPLLFGCIPLAEIIKAVANLADNTDQVPKFISEASTQLESFITGLGRTYALVANLASQPADIASAAISVFNGTLNDILAQATGYAAAQVAPLQNAATQLTAAVDDVAGDLQSLQGKSINDATLAAPLGDVAGHIATARNRITDLVNAVNTPINGISLAAGLRQQALSFANKLDAFLADLNKLANLVNQGLALYTALDDIVGDPGQLGDLFSNAAELKTRIEAVGNAFGGFKPAISDFNLLSGAPRKIVLDALSIIEQLTDGADLLQLVELLTGDELTIRFDWNPRISSWWLPGANPNSDDPIFRANDERGFIVAVEAKVKKNGGGTPKIGVVCSLKHFDLVLIAPASFLELNFEKIEFAVDSSSKMDVDVLLSDIKFVGPLSFVETLRDLIPLDGFSDPPYLDITPQGIDAGFDISLPGISVGVLNINNLSLGAGFCVPFIGQPLSVRFNFCTREQPFLLTVYMFGGGGFFGVTIDPHGVQILEASFEFGASISVDFGVASGGVHVMAGLYYRMEMDESSLTGYFRLGGHVDVLGLISASLELYLELRYEFESGKCVGKAELTIEVQVLVFSGSVTITCERKFAGSNGDPTLRQMLGFDPSLPLPDELALINDQTDYAWREYCEAFA
ncbi:hypothetical protein [Thiosocius teredinicola]|uniref:hypothetical protein n=1 Tax=Thiosocius teredinicola TaxID=1973002 RepID=UPI002FE43B58